MSDLHQPPPPSGEQKWPSEQSRPNPAWASSPYGAPVYPAPATGPVPLWAPLYGASLPAAVSRFFKKYATFAGRASRSEYWWWTLVAFIVSVILNVIMLIGGAAGAKIGANGTSVPGPGYIIGVILAAIWFLAVLVPSLAVTVRRLHDANYSGWMLLLGLVPFVGGIILLVFTVMEPKPEGQRFDAPGVQTGAWQPS